MFRMEERPRPSVLPKEEVWTFCEELGEKYHMEPLEVFSRLVWIGKKVAEIEEKGVIVVARKNLKECEIKAFKS